LRTSTRLVGSVVADRTTSRIDSRRVNDALYVVGGSRAAGDDHGATGSKVVERFFVRK